MTTTTAILNTSYADLMFQGADSDDEDESSDGSNDDDDIQVGLSVSIFCTGRKINQSIIIWYL